MTTQARHHVKPRRRVWFTGHRGIPTTAKHEDSVLRYEWDFGDVLASAETLSTATWEAVGVTITNSSVSSTVLTVDIGASGEATVTLTTSTGRIIAQTYRWRATDRRREDYT